MNSLIFDIRRYTIHDGPGIRTTVFFKGCPLRCLWCHNPESQEVWIEQVSVQRVLDGKVFESKRTIGSQLSAVELISEIEKDEVFYFESGGGVTFSGGEPLMQADALLEIMKLCKDKGYHVAVDTCGHAEPASVNKIKDFADLWLYDLKLVDDVKHIEYTGVSNELALKNLEILAESNKEIIIRFPLITGVTDRIDNLDGISALMNKLNLKRIDILPYHSIAAEKYRRLGRANTLDGMKEPDKEKVDDIIAYFTKQDFLAGTGI